MKNKKTIIKKSIVAALMLTILIGNANERFNIKHVSNINKTIITLNNVKQGNKLLIKDINGIVLYKEDIQNAGNYSKGFDLTALPEGDYFFELEKDIEIKSIPFKVDSKKVIVNDNKTTIFKPFVSLKNNYVYLTKLALNKEPLDVKIYSEDNQLIYSEKITNTKTIEKAYKLSLNGNYRIVLVSNGREYYKNIAL